EGLSFGETTQLIGWLNRLGSILHVRCDGSRSSGRNISLVVLNAPFIARACSLVVSDEKMGGVQLSKGWNDGKVERKALYPHLSNGLRPPSTSQRSDPFDDSGVDIDRVITVLESV